VIDELKITFEALNLTDTKFDKRVDLDANRIHEYTQTGRNFLLGARYTY